MTPTHRIVKRKAEVRRGRGRMSTWATTWKKRLAVLRMCGLQLNELLEILSILSGGATPNVERTAQDNLQKLLGKGWPRMCAADKQTMRERLQLLKDLDQRDQTSKAWRRSLKSRRTRLLTAISRPRSLTCVHGPTASPTIGVNSFQIGTRVQPQGELCEIPSEISDAHKVKPEHRVSRESSGFGITGAMTTIIEDENLPSTDNQSIASTPSRKVSLILQRASFTSSQRPLVKELLKMRYSFSSRATSTLSSTFTFSDGSIERPELPPLSNPPLTNPPCMSFTPEAIVERHHNKIHRANFDLAEACCFPNPDCIHRQIQNAILGTSTKLHDLLRTVPAVDEVSGSVNNLLVGMLNNPTLQSINTPDSNGNNALFFAARSAAPAEVLLPILHRTANINAVNKDGQTFLFLLDPERLHGHPCVCTRGPLGGPFLSHTSSMGCLMSDLERWHFNFEQLDHDCRSFLSFQCASPYFDIEWFRAQMEQTPEWARRLVCLSRVHDSSAMSYVCFIAEGTKRAEVVSLISQWGSTAILTKENTDHYDEYGRTELVNCVESVYMVGGESRVLSDVKKMVSRGVNINGRSRDGSTALIAAAQRCYPDMVAYLLKMGAHVDHRDEYGFTAMDYAAEGFNRSRGRNVAAAVTARFFKSATRLLEYTKLSRSKTQTPEASVLQNLNHSASRRARRSLASMTILEQYRAEG